MSCTLWRDPHFGQTRKSPGRQTSVGMDPPLGARTARRAPAVNGIATDGDGNGDGNVHVHVALAVPVLYESRLSAGSDRAESAAGASGRCGAPRDARGTRRRNV